jgi:general secretion pathway protein H
MATRGGFTLLELLLVIALIAMVGTGVAFSLRETGDQQLEREAQRLVALLDAARAQSRATGVAVVWRADAQGFEFVGLQPAQPAPTPWLAPGTAVRGASTLVLGPEPIIGRQQVDLLLEGRVLGIATDGLRPFSVLAVPGEGAGVDSP